MLAQAEGLLCNESVQANKNFNNFLINGPFFRLLIYYFTHGLMIIPLSSSVRMLQATHVCNP